MALGLRYPKAHETGHIRSSAVGTNNQLSAAWGTGSRYASANAGMFLLVNPARYSALRKVTFWASARLFDATPPSTAQCRLRVTVTSSSSTVRTPAKGTISPGSIVRLRGASSIFPLETPTDEAVLYSKAGDWVPLQDVASFADRKCSLFTVEFERFFANSVDFFNDWDSIAAANTADQYVGYILTLEVESGRNFGAGDVFTQNIQFWNCGMSIVQAPAGINKTTTLVNNNVGWISYGAEADAFQNSRAVPFVYHADQWDNITSMHVWSILPNSGAAADAQFRVKVAHMPPETGAVGDVSRYEESFSDPGAGANIVWAARSADILPSIQDGDYLGIEWRRLVGLAHGQPWGMIEIIQEDFNKTVCHHPSSISLPIERTEVSFVDEGYSKGYFDPLWYANFPDDRILTERVTGGLKQVAIDSDPKQVIMVDADLQADPDSSATALEVQPEVTSTPVANLGYKIRDGDIQTNNPINLAGARALFLRFKGNTWLSGQPGDNLLAYGLDVPNREFLDIGPVFELGAFNPEGCAATSAGLGEPGVLVITNGSVIPKKFNPTAADTSGEIEDAGIPVPYEGETPTFLVNSTAASPSGGLDAGSYTYRYTFRNCCTNRESDPNPEDIVVDTSGASPAASVTFSFAGVRIPADPQICEICLYRTVEGGDYPIMAKVGCFNPDDTTTFVDTLSDDALDFVNDGLSILNAPNPCTPIVVDFRNRLFMMGDIPNLTPAGTVSVVNGSDLVVGDGNVEWDRCLEGKFIQIDGDCRSYEILRVLPPVAGTSPPIARLRLVEEYEGSTDTGMAYTICGRPNRLYFSEPLEPEYWPAANFIDVEPGDGDRLMGAVSNFDRLVICKRRKTYVLTFRENPGVEVIVPTRISSDIGCVGPRTFAQIESGSVWLADRGLAIYDGRTVRHVKDSELMNDLFVNPDNPNYVRRDRNGRVIDAVGVFYPKREQYLLLLPTVQTERGCNLMLVWDVHLQNVTLLKFCQEFQSMVVAKDSDGNERVYMGDTNGFVWIYDVGDSDGVGFPNATGTVRGTVTSAGIDPESGASVLTDSSASFITGGLPAFANLSGLAGLSGALDGDDLGLAGVCIYTRRAGADLDEPWTVRTIYAATQDTLYVTPQWGPDTPNPGDDYMIGAIEFECLFKPQNYGTDDVLKRNWRQVVVHEIESFASKLRVELLPDFALSDPEELTVVDPVTQETGEGRVFRMDYSKGRQTRPVGREIHNFEAVRMTNFAPEEPIQIINHILMVTPKASK